MSTAKQEDGASLSDQEKAGLAYCARQGYEVAAVIPETASGHDSLDIREGLGRVRDMLRRGEAQILVVWRYDRAARSIIDTLLLHREVVEAGGRLESATQGPIEDSAMGRGTLALIGTFGEMEWEAIIARTQQGLRSRAESGKILTGKNAKLGYRYVGERKDTYELDPETVPIVQHIFDLAYKGMSLHSIANTLTKEGVPTATEILQARGYPVRKTASGWRRQMVYQLLTDPSYCGRHIVYRRKLVKRRVQDETGRTFIRQVLKLRTEDDSSRIEQTIPAIVSENVWNTVQANLKERQLQTTRTSKVPDDTLLKGFAYCGHCGAKMVSHAHHNGYRQYRCSRRRQTATYAGPPCPGGDFAIKAKPVDQDVWSKVVAMNGDRDHVRRMVESRQEEAEQGIANVERDKATIEAEVADCEQQLELLQKRLGTETNDFMYANLRQEILRLGDTLTQLESRKSRVQDRENNADSILAAFEEARQVVGMLMQKPDTIVVLSNENKRKVMRALGVRIFLYATNSEYAKTHDTRWAFAVQPVGGTVESMHTRNIAVGYQRTLYFTWDDWLATAS